MGWVAIGMMLGMIAVAIGAVVGSALGYVATLAFRAVLTVVLLAWT